MYVDFTVRQRIQKLLLYPMLMSFLMRRPGSRGPGSGIRYGHSRIKRPSYERSKLHNNISQSWDDDSDDWSLSELSLIIETRQATWEIEAPEGQRWLTSTLIYHPSGLCHRAFTSTVRKREKAKEGVYKQYVLNTVEHIPVHPSSRLGCGIFRIKSQRQEPLSGLSING